MGTVFTNGIIHTMDEATEGPAWVAVDGGRIVAVGTGPLPQGEVYDLAGRTLLPGFQDAHVHPALGGLALIRCDLHPSSTLSAFQAAVAGYAERHPDAPWILGGGWSMDSMPHGVARAEWLDAVVSDRPVLLHSSEGHAAWVNSRALDIAGINPATPDPPDGRIERDGNGAPIGTLQEGAVELVARHAPPDTVADLEAAILAAQRVLVGLGITGWQDAWVDETAHRAYRRLDSAGLLLAHVVGAQWWHRRRGLEQCDDLVERTRHGGRRYRPAAVKLMVDGVCENGTAALLDPYVGSDDRGLSFIPREILLEVVPRLVAAGIQPHFHTIGDRAVSDALDAIAGSEPAARDRVRPHLAHVQLIADTDVARFAELNVTANVQAFWACQDACMTDLTIPRLGAERAQRQYRFRDLADAGVRLAFGSDWSVSTANPFEQMAVAVTRQDAPGAEPFLPAQALRVDEVLWGFTMGSAYVNHRDGISGSITPGKMADLIVVDADPRREPDLAAISVDATFIGGVLVAGR